MTSVRKSLALSFAQRNASLIIQFVSTLIIARLLTPHEIGIFSIGAVIVSFSHIVRDLGVSNYIIQERELTRDRIKSAQTIVWITSWSLALLLYLLASWAGEFYAEPGVTLTMQVIAISFLLLPFGAITVALLTREMAFGKILVINLCSTTAQSATAIILASSGFGFISLAWSAVAGAMVAVIGSILCRQRDQPWLPGIREWRRVFSAGTKLSGTSAFYEMGLGGPELITGRTLGFEAVAYFSRGFGAAMMLLRALVDSVLPVAISYFARQSRAESDMKSPYLKGLDYMGAIAFPAFACLSVMASPIVLFLYGQQWNAAVQPLQILCIGLAFLAVGNVASSVLVGSGQIGIHFWLQAVFQSLKILLVVIGAKSLGLTGVTIAVAVGDFCLSMGCFLMANRYLQISFTAFLRQIAPVIGIAVITVGFVHLANWTLGPSQALVLQLAIPGLAAVLGWLIALHVFRHPLLSEIRALMPSKS